MGGRPRLVSPPVGVESPDGQSEAPPTRPLVSHTVFVRTKTFRTELAGSLRGVYTSGALVNVLRPEELLISTPRV